MLLSKLIEVSPHQKSVLHYEELGYSIPKAKDKKGVLRIPKGTTIMVKPEDLPLNSHYKVLVKCDNPTCNKEYLIKYNHYVESQRLHKGLNYCYDCRHLCLVDTIDDFIEKINKMYGEGEFTVLGEYKNNKEKILIKHNKCIDGIIHEFKISPLRMIQKGNICFSGCPKCNLLYKSERFKKSQEYFEREVYELTDNDYTVIGEYVNADTKILMKHNVCNHEWEVIPDNFLNGTRCPICTSTRNSKGECVISEFLKKNNIYFIKEYRFENCRNKYPLPFDFAIFGDKEKTKLLFLIEYQGSQHYAPQSFGGVSEEKAINRFVYTLMNDEIKENFCKEKNINLIKIPYWEKDNINKIIEQTIQSSNS